MTKMTVMFECDSSNFPTLMMAMAPKMNLVSSFQVDCEKEPVSRKRGKILHPSSIKAEIPIATKGANYRNSRVAKVIVDALEEAGPSGSTHKELQDVLVKHGFSPLSQSPATSYMSRDGIITKFDGGRLALTKFWDKQP
jgi:hypothetical protein